MESELQYYILGIHRDAMPNKILMACKWDAVAKSKPGYDIIMIHTTEEIKPYRPNHDQ
jgi:hypothetical protein